MHVRKLQYFEELLVSGFRKPENGLEKTGTINDSHFCKTFTRLQEQEKFFFVPRNTELIGCFMLGRLACCRLLVSRY